MLFQKKLSDPGKLFSNSVENSDLTITSTNSRVPDLVKLAQISSKDLHYLKMIDDLMEEHSDIIANRHYEMIMAIPEIKIIFDKYTNKERYTTAIRKYFVQLTKPTFDDAYIDYRTVIGEVHSRIGLHDEWYIGSYIRVYEYLLPFIIEEFQKSPADLSNILVALNRIITFDSLLVLGAYQEANDYKMVEKINEVMEYVIGIDQVQDLLNNVDETMDEAEHVNSSAQELNSSVREVADHAVSVSENTGEMVEEARTGQAMIEESLNGFLSMGQDFVETKQKIDSLVKDVEGISEVVDFIRNVSEQTNLLALNASIEAARAGENGRGFAVVANEVRNLAEQTGESVDKIGDAILKMQNESTEVGSLVDEMAAGLNNRVSQTQESITTLNQLINKVGEIGESTGSIAAIAEEQSASTDEITNRIGLVHSHVENMKLQSNLTGQAVFEVSMEVDQLRKRTIKEIPELTPSQLERIKEAEELIKKWWEYNRALGFEK